MIPGSTGGHYPVVTAKSDGSIVVVWHNLGSNQILINSSPDGISWGQTQVVGSDAVWFWFPFAPTPGKSLYSVPSVAVADRGPLPDRVYVSYAPAPSAMDRDNSDIIVKYSDDLTNWITCFSTSSNNKAQFHSWIDVDPMTGVPYVIWFDCREDPNTPAVYAKRYVTASTDDGDTWLNPVPISDNASYSTIDFSYGDYNASDAYAGMAFDVWPHMPGGDSTADIYTDRAVLTGHLITVTGTSAADTYDVQMDASNTFVKIWENTPTSNPPSFIMHNDALTGTGAGLLFNLGAGNDIVNIAPGVPVATTINGQDGNDSITGGAGDDVVNGGNGIDTLRGAGGDNTLDYNNFSVGVTIDLTTTSAGPNGALDSIPLKDFDNAIGGSGNDIITGNNDPNFLDGRGGADTIDGDSDGNTLSPGQPGEDSILGGLGNDSIFGDGANDTIDGQAGNDTINGGAGHDSLFGGDDTDTMYGDFGNDTLNGDSGNDLMYGQNGHDTLDGGVGSDILDGGSGNDSLYGQAGKDTLTGGAGNDRMEGGDNDDRFFAFKDGGMDTLLGGQGEDTANLDPGDDHSANDIEHLIFGP